jgi:hypothetical protein
MKQQGLIAAPSALHIDGNGRLNGYVIRRNSSWMGRLTSAIADYIRPKAVEWGNLELWRSLTVAEIIDLHSAEADQYFSSLLQKATEDTCIPSGILGLLLTLNRNEAQRVDGRTLEFVASRMSHIGTDARLLNGLEKALNTTLK